MTYPLNRIYYLDLSFLRHFDPLPSGSETKRMKEMAAGFLINGGSKIVTKKTMNELLLIHHCITRTKTLIIFYLHFYSLL